jgi:hypothetical protein
MGDGSYDQGSSRYSTTELGMQQDRKRRCNPFSYQGQAEHIVISFTWHSIMSDVRSLVFFHKRGHGSLASCL